MELVLYLNLINICAYEDLLKFEKFNYVGHISKYLLENNNFTLPFITVVFIHSSNGICLQNCAQIHC